MAHALIDKAVEKCGSRYKLAKRLEVSEQALSAIYLGKRHMSPKMAARIAAIAGEDPQKAAIVALIESEDDPAEREALKKVFFPFGAVAMLLFFIIGASIASLPSSARAQERAAVIDSPHIVRTRRNRLGKCRAGLAFVVGMLFERIASALRRPAWPHETTPRDSSGFRGNFPEYRPDAPKPSAPAEAKTRRRHRPSGAQAPGLGATSRSTVQMPPSPARPPS